MSFYLTILMILILLAGIICIYLGLKPRKNLGLPSANPEESAEINSDNCEQPLARDEAVLAAGLTDCGLIKKNNEDSFLIIPNPGHNNHTSLPLLCAVADGMGGTDHGELAAAEAIEALREEFNQPEHQTNTPLHWQNWLRNSFLKAQLAITKKSKKRKIKGTTGTTLVATVVTGKKAIVANVGDSRAYLLRNGELQQITKDHSLVSLLVEKGLIAPNEVYTHPRRNEIMRFLGQNTELEIDVLELDLVPGDNLLLCSDGLWEMVRNPLLKNILIDSANPVEACARLIRAANLAGGQDNITAINVKI